MFDKKGVIEATVEDNKMDNDTAEMAIIESGASDMQRDGMAYTIYTGTKNLHSVKDKLAKAGFNIENTGLYFVPKDYKHITGKTTADQLLALIETIETDDDVTQIDNNFEISEDILNRLL